MDLNSCNDAARSSSQLDAASTSKMCTLFPRSAPVREGAERSKELGCVGEEISERIEESWSSSISALGIILVGESPCLN